jgi:hypothetical protein
VSFRIRRFELWSYSGVILLAFLLRLIWDALIRVHPVSDGSVYDLFARNLASGSGYVFSAGVSTARWPVGTSFIYSLLYRVFGMSYLPILILNLGISLATLWMTMRLAEKWFNRDVAIYCGFILALWPNQIEFGTVLASELLFSFFLMSWFAVDEFLRADFVVKGVVLGSIGAALSYVRPTGLLIPAIPCGVALIRGNGEAASRVVGKTVVVYLVMLALIAPWSIRNTRVFGRFVLISTNGGDNLWQGNNPAGDGQGQREPASMRNMNEAVREAELGAIAKAYIAHYPGRFVIRTLKKIYWLNNRETIGVYWNEVGIAERFGARALVILKVVNDGYWWVCLLLAIAGELVLARQVGVWGALTHPVTVIWVYFVLVHAVIVVEDRFHMPSVPFMAMLVALTLARYVKVGSSAQAHG